MGRPSKRTPEIIATVIEGLRRGTPLTVICAAADMPCDDTVRAWAEADQQLSRDIARAREIGFDQIALDALNIADTPQEGVRTTTDEDGEVKEVREDMLGHRKLQVETRLKLLAKWDPKRYGDATMLKHANADGENLDLAAAIAAGRARAAGGE